MEKWKKVRPLVIPCLVAAAIVAVTSGLLFLGVHLERIPPVSSTVYIPSILGCIIILGVIPSIFIITYGYKTGDRLTSISTGILTFPLFWFSYVLFVFWYFGLRAYTNLSTNSLGWLWFSTSMVVLGTIGTFEGHFASRKRLRLAILLGILWSLLLFFSFSILTYYLNIWFYHPPWTLIAPLP